MSTPMEDICVQYVTTAKRRGLWRRSDNRRSMQFYLLGLQPRDAYAKLIFNSAGVYEVLFFGLDGKMASHCSNVGDNCTSEQLALLRRMVVFPAAGSLYFRYGTDGNPEQIFLAAFIPNGSPAIFWGAREGARLQESLFVDGFLQIQLFWQMVDRGVLRNKTAEVLSGGIPLAHHKAPNGRPVFFYNGQEYRHPEATTGNTTRLAHQMFAIM